MRVIPADFPHIDQIEPDQRTHIELSEFFGCDYRQGIRQSLIGSTQAWTMISGDKVIAMFGVGPLCMLEGLGRLWIVTSDLCAHRRAFARATKRTLPKIFEQYETIVSAFDPSHADVERWARWLGAEVRRGEDLSHITLRRP